MKYNNNILQQWMSNFSLIVDEIYTYSNNNIQYKIKLNANEQTLTISIQDSKTFEKWKNIFSSSYIIEITEKSGQKLDYKLFMSNLLQALKKKTDKLYIDIMSSFDLETIKIKKGGQPSQQNLKANKRYLILSIQNGQSRNHYPLPLNFIDIEDIEKLKQMISTIKDQLQELRSKNVVTDKSSSVISQSSTTQADQIKSQNEQLKIMIKDMEQQISQKKGAVQMDLIIRQKCDLELKVQSIKREQNKQIAKLKSIYQLKQRQINEMRNQVNLIHKQLDLGQEANPKLKNHIIRVNRVNQTELNNSKKLLSKLIREIQNINKNILNAKNTEKKILAKIKQIQAQLDQSKKKANIKQISNRLYSPASSKKSNLSAPNNRNQVTIGLRNNTGSIAKSDDNSSANSGQSKPRSYNGPIKQNIVKTNILLKPKQSLNYKSPHMNPLLKTTPALNTNLNTKQTNLTLTSQNRPVNRLINQNINKYNNTGKPAIPIVQTKKEIPTKSSISIEKKKNNYTYQGITNTNPKIQVVLQPNKSTSKQVKKAPIQNSIVERNAFTKNNVKAGTNDKNIFNRMEQIKNRFGKVNQVVTNSTQKNKMQKIRQSYKVNKKV